MLVAMSILAASVGSDGTSEGPGRTASRVSVIAAVSTTRNPSTTTTGSFPNKCRSRCSGRFGSPFSTFSGTCP